MTFAIVADCSSLLVKKTVMELSTVTLPQEKLLYNENETEPKTEIQEHKIWCKSIAICVFKRKAMLCCLTGSISNVCKFLFAINQVWFTTRGFPVK